VSDNDTSGGSLSLRGLSHLGVVYVVWSSTYLAIRLAVGPGGGFPAFSLGSLRCLAAVPVLLIWAWFRGARIRLTRREAVVIAVSGVLLWTTGNGFVVLAEQRTESALAALIVSSTPIWVVLLESVIDRRWPTPLGMVALVVGFVGAGLISVPRMSGGLDADALSTMILLVAALSWGGGSLFQRRHALKVDPIVSSAYQQLFGGLGMGLLSVASREPWPTPTPRAWAGFAFLLIFGSLLAFTSYLTALRLLPTRIVFTYAYVNPVLAVALGSLFLDERIGLVTAMGAVLVLLGVAGAFRVHAQTPRKA
jgi:drug/metabolite transporter (DMT)-like permease